MHQIGEREKLLWTDLFLNSIKISPPEYFWGLEHIWQTVLAILGALSCHAEQRSPSLAADVWGFFCIFPPWGESGCEQSGTSWLGATEKCLKIATWHYSFHHTESGQWSWEMLVFKVLSFVHLRVCSEIFNKNWNLDVSSKFMNVYDLGMKMYTSQPITVHLFL